MLDDALTNAYFHFFCEPTLPPGDIVRNSPDTGASDVTVGVSAPLPAALFALSSKLLRRPIQEHPKTSKNVQVHPDFSLRHFSHLPMTRPAPPHFSSHGSINFGNASWPLDLSYPDLLDPPDQPLCRVQLCLETPPVLDLLNRAVLGGIGRPFLACLAST